VILTVDSSNVAYALSFVVDQLPNRKIEQIKTIRSMFGLGLKEAKDLVEAEHVRREPTHAVQLAITNMLNARRWSEQDRAFDQKSTFAVVGAR
jgi:hypothetical protein